jgi:hypothetical protein
MAAGRVPLPVAARVEVRARGATEAPDRRKVPEPKRVLARRRPIAAQRHVRVRKARAVGALMLTSIAGVGVATEPRWTAVLESTSMWSAAGGRADAM